MQPCWHCKKACCGCSWSQSLTPVEGWEAKPIIIKDSDDRSYPSYEIKSCPLYEFDGMLKVSLEKIRKLFGLRGTSKSIKKKIENGTISRLAKEYGFEFLIFLKEDCKTIDEMYLREVRIDG